MILCSVKNALGGHSLSKLYAKESLQLVGACVLLKQTVSDPYWVLFNTCRFMCSLSPSTAKRKWFSR